MLRLIGLRLVAVAVGRNSSSPVSVRYKCVGKEGLYCELFGGRSYYRPLAIQP